jgi:hypothetical protein
MHVHQVRFVWSSLGRTGQITEGAGQISARRLASSWRLASGVSPTTAN